MKLFWMIILWIATFCSLLQIKAGNARSILEPLHVINEDDPTLDRADMPGMGKRFARALEDDNNVTTVEPLTTTSSDDDNDIFVIIIDWFGWLDWLRWFWW
ncbi:hypothetical protein HNY73_013918 [Argiope bruennichi]|uniref:Uncharacterized protein n=1 Tax=Argiope bruennichi TaxID=94029 RepID=A0A8T0EMM8_ARGBR|nr:hypothetical protein HNY73_013918 [Argiope bruennichi]